MANAGTVTVDFAAEVAKFNAQMKQVNDRVKSVESSFKKMAGVVDSALKLFSVGIAANFIRSAAEAADQLGKTADKLGISTERLTAFQLAAADAGVETGTLTKLLVDAQRRLGDAASGTGATFEAIQSLGLSVRDLQRLSPDQLFLRYADAINQLTSRSEQFSVAQELFGRSAQEAFSLIAGGSEAVNAAAVTVERLGLALTRVDIAKIEVANDKLGLLAKTSQAFGQQLAASLAPFVSEFVDRITASGVAADEARGKFELFAQSVFVSFEIVANAVKTFDAVISGVVFTIAKANEVVFGLFRKGEEFTVRLQESLGLDTLAQSFTEDAKAMGDAENFFASISERAAERVRNSANSIKSFAQILEQADQIQLRAQQQAEEAAARQQELAAGITGESRIETLQFEFDSELALRDEFFNLRLQQEYEFLQELAGVRKDLDFDARAAEEQRVAQSIMESEAQVLAFRTAAYNSTIGALQILGSKQKAFAIAAVAIEKGKALFEAFVNTKAAVTKQLNSGDPYTAIPRAVAVGAFGAIQIAAIAASAYGQISAHSSGGGASLGTPANPIFTDTSSGSGDGTRPGAQQRTQINVTVEGVITPGSARAIADALKDVIDNSDVVLFSSGSAQAAEIRGG